MSSNPPPNNLEAKESANEANGKESQDLCDPNQPRRADPTEVNGVAECLSKPEEEERVKNDKLLQLSNQDRKAPNRVRKTRSMTKSANKSWMDDSKDCLNESGADQGEFQPDEDDGGYTSNYADKMLEYETEPGAALSKPAVTVKVPIGRVGTNEQLLKFAKQAAPEPALPTKVVVDKNAEGEKYEFVRPVTAKEKAELLELVGTPGSKKSIQLPTGNSSYKRLLVNPRAVGSEQNRPSASGPRKNLGVGDISFSTTKEAVYDPNRPRRGDRKEVRLKEGVAKFLAKRDEEDRKKKKKKIGLQVQASRVPKPKPVDYLQVCGVRPLLPFKIPKKARRDKDVTPAKKPRISESGDGKLLHRELSKSRAAEPSSPAARSSSPFRKPLEKPYRQSEAAKPRERDPYRGNGQSRPDSRPQGNPDRQSGERSRDPPPRDNRVNVDKNRKPASPGGFKPKPGPSRESLQSGLSDSRENARMGMSSMKNNPQRDSDRRPIQKDAPAARRDDVQYRRETPAPRRDDSQQRREVPATRRDESQYRKEAPASRCEEVSYKKDVQQSRRDGPPPGRSEMQPQRRDVPTQRRDMPSQRRDNIPPQKRDNIPPQRRDNIPPQRKDNLPPPRREMLPSGRGDMGSPRRDAPIAGKRDAPPPAIWTMDMADELPMCAVIRKMDVVDKNDDTGYVIFAVAQKKSEEQRSLRIGIQEDMEDIRREEEEKRRKMGKVVKKAVR